MSVATSYFSVFCLNGEFLIFGRFSGLVINREITNTIQDIHILQKQNLYTNEIIKIKLYFIYYFDDQCESAKQGTVWFLLFTSIMMSAAVEWFCWIICYFLIVVTQYIISGHARVGHFLDGVFKFCINLNVV